MNVPKGQLKIARRFNAGVPATPGHVPKGRLKEGGGGYIQPSLRDSYETTTFSALKRRAILGLSLRDAVHRISEKPSNFFQNFEQ